MGFTSSLTLVGFDSSLNLLSLRFLLLAGSAAIGIRLTLRLLVRGVFFIAAACNSRLDEGRLDEGRRLGFEFRD